MTEAWTAKQRARWPLLIAQLEGSWTPPSWEAIPQEAIASLDASLSAAVENALPSSEERDARERIATKIAPVLERAVRGSKVLPFGSAETGLVLRGGDVDLCVVVSSDKGQKRLVRDIARALREENYTAIQPITRAKVPIVKCRDAVTHLPIDVSVNNTLALRNTELIRSYVQLDERVRALVVLVKHWALHRGLADAFGGTLSSYAWTVLALRHLQSSTPPLVPNLQEGDPRRVETMDGRTFDTTIADGEALSCPLSLGELFAGFFHRWFVEHAWSSQVVSLRQSAELNRKKHGWPLPKPSPLDVLQGRAERCGEHLLPIEDPFDLNHDLSRVVRPEGWADIMEEGLRMWKGLVEGASLESLLATSDHATLPEAPRGLFDDLRDRPRDEVETMLQDARDAHDEVALLLEALSEERRRTISMAKAMRGTLQPSSGMPEDVVSLLETLRERAVAMKQFQQHRDGIDEVAMLPMNRIGQELQRLHRSLTSEVDVDHVPSLRNEQRDFARFLAVQAMHQSKPNADASHAAYVDLLRAQRDDVKQFAALHLTVEPKHEARLAEVDLKAVRIRTGDVDEYDRRANLLSNLVRDQRRERKRLSREIGRLTAYLGGGRRSNRNQRRRSEGHQHRQPRPKVDVEEVRQRAMDGGTLSLEDLGALLDGGGVVGTGNNAPSRSRQRHTSPKKRQSQRRPKPSGRRHDGQGRRHDGSR
jgi:predicted nucleotidyltransferase